MFSREGKLMPLSLLFALRFLKSSKDEKSISIMIKICFISILISTFALTLVSAIMNGYEKATHEKLKGIHADVIINAQGKAIDFEKLSSVLGTEFSSLIHTASPVALSQVILQSNKIGTLCALKGIDPILEPRVSALKDMIRSSLYYHAPWHELLQGSKIFIGETLAKQLGVTVGDTVTMLYGEDILNNKVTLQSQHAQISGLFKTGINEFDEYVVICSLSFFHELFNYGITQVHVKLKDPSSETVALEMLKKRLPLEIISWKNLYPALVSALALEKYAMFIILALVSLIASMNIVSLLFMFVTQKQRDIALLKSMGMADRMLIIIFMLLGMCITVGAALCGIVAAVGASWILNHYPLIQLPDIYYVTHLSAFVELNTIMATLGLTSLLSFFATLLPAYKIKYLSIAHTLKNGVA
jgi:lipoprotein-releasing system permease protein